jgi:DNA-binding XRE family transcriptional regulator
MEKLLTFDSHLKEMMKNPEFAKGYEDERRRIGLSIKIAMYRQQELKITQAELAKRAGITQQQVSKLEHGENCNIAT